MAIAAPSRPTRRRQVRRSPCRLARPPAMQALPAPPSWGLVGGRGAARLVRSHLGPVLFGRQRPHVEVRLLFQSRPGPVRQRPVTRRAGEPPAAAPPSLGRRAASARNAAPSMAARRTAPPRHRLASRRRSGNPMRRSKDKDDGIASLCTPSPSDVPTRLSVGVVSRPTARRGSSGRKRVLRNAFWPRGFWPWGLVVGVCVVVLVAGARNQLELLTRG